MAWTIWSDACLLDQITYVIFILQLILFYRPSDTFHVPTRKFLEQEVFISNEYKTLTFKEIIGRCFVLSVRDYFTKKPQGFNDQDLYVCESRYSTKSK